MYAHLPFQENGNSYSSPLFKTPRVSNTIRSFPPFFQNQLVTRLFEIWPASSLLSTALVRVPLGSDLSLFENFVADLPFFDGVTVFLLHFLLTPLFASGAHTPPILPPPPPGMSNWEPLVTLSQQHPPPLLHFLRIVYIALRPTSGRPELPSPPPTWTYPFRLRLPFCKYLPPPSPYSTPAAPPLLVCLPSFSPPPTIFEIFFPKMPSPLLIPFPLLHFHSAAFFGNKELFSSPLFFFFFKLVC